MLSRNLEKTLIERCPWPTSAVTNMRRSSICCWADRGQDAATVLRPAASISTGCAATWLNTSTTSSQPGDHPGRREADRQLPARPAARRDPCAVVRPRGGDRRQRAGRDVPERESHAVYFLQEQDMTRFDAVNYISHGIAKAPGRSAQRRCRVAESRRKQHRAGARGEAKRGNQDALDALLRQPQQEGEGRQDRSADRPRARGRAHDPDPVPPHEEQPALCRRSRRRQDRDRRGPGAAHRAGRSAGSAAKRDDLRARHGRAARRHALSRRFRGAAEGGASPSSRRSRARSCSSTRSTR